MIPFIPIAVGAALVGGVAYLLTRGGAGSGNHGNHGNDEEPSILEKNFKHLRKGLENEKKGKNRKTIAIIGQPGSGKSSLLKKVTDGKCKPLPEIGQQVDATNWHKELTWSFFTFYKDYIFVDIPGYDTKNHPTRAYLKHFPFKKFGQILLVLKDAVHESDEKVFKEIGRLLGEDTAKKVFVVRNFSESLSEEDKEAIRSDYNKSERFDLNAKDMEVIFSSAKTQEGIEKIKKVVGMD